MVERIAPSREKVINFIEWYLVKHALGAPALGNDIIERGMKNGIPDWKIQHVSAWMVRNNKLIKYREKGSGINGRWYWRLSSPGFDTQVEWK